MPGAISLCRKQKPADCSAGFSVALYYERGTPTSLKIITTRLVPVLIRYPQLQIGSKFLNLLQTIFRGCPAVAQRIERRSDESAGAGSNPASRTTPEWPRSSSPGVILFSRVCLNWKIELKHEPSLSQIYEVNARGPLELR